MVKIRTTSFTLIGLALLVPAGWAEEVRAPAIKSVTIRPLEDVRPLEDARFEEPQVPDDTPNDVTGSAATDALVLPGAVDESKTEVVRTRYPNRIVKIERQVAQDEQHNYLNHGAWTMWTPEGEIIATGQYRWGKRQGSWTRLFVGEEARRRLDKDQQGFETPLVSKAEFADDQIHGTWLIVDARGRKVRSWDFNHGALHGEALAWYPNGARIHESHYDNGVPFGEMREWSADGKLVKKHQFQNGQRLAPILKRYDSGGVEMEGQYLLARDVLDVQVDWWGGDVRIELAGKAGKDVKQGNWTHYYQDGAKAYEGTYVEGHPTGEHLWWYSNGQKQIQGSFANGEPNGHWVWWHKNGLKQMDGHYVKGVQDDKWIRWAADGKVVQVDDHSLGADTKVAAEVPERVEVIGRQPRDTTERTATQQLEPALPLKPATRLRR